MINHYQNSKKVYLALMLFKLFLFVDVYMSMIITITLVLIFCIFIGIITDIDIHGFLHPVKIHVDNPPLNKKEKESVRLIAHELFRLLCETELGYWDIRKEIKVYNHNLKNSLNLNLLEEIIDESFLKYDLNENHIQTTPIQKNIIVSLIPFDDNVWSEYENTEIFWSRYEQMIYKSKSNTQNG